MINRNSETALYKQVEQYVRQLIVTKKLKPDDLIPSELQLAKHFGVSRITTRKALEGLCQQNMLYRIQGKGTFVSKESVSKAQSANRIGVVFPFTSTSLCLQLLEGIEDVAKDKGYEVVLKNTNGVPEIERSIVEDIISENVLGLIILSCSNDNEMSEFYKHITETGPPIIFVDRYINNLDCDYVVSDNFSGAYEATKYLLNNGHKNNAILIPPYRNATSVRDRIGGYKSALEDYGIEVNQNLVLRDIGDGDVDSIREFLQTIDTTAIFAINDHLTIDALKAIKDIKLNVPDDISVIGFDDINRLKFIDKAITLIKTPIYEMGKASCRIIIDKLNYKSNLKRQVVLPVELIIEDSVKNLTLSCNYIS